MYILDCFRRAVIAHTSAFPLGVEDLYHTGKYNVVPYAVRNDKTSLCALVALLRVAVPKKRFCSEPLAVSCPINYANYGPSKVKNHHHLQLPLPIQQTLLSPNRLCTAQNSGSNHASFWNTNAQKSSNTSNWLLPNRFSGCSAWNSVSTDSVQTSCASTDN